MPARPAPAIALLLAAGLAASGCSWRPSMPSLPSLSDFRLPSVYRLTVQQGNVINQDMIDKLKPGMTKRQVVFVMGEPVLKNTFREDRWDYIYTLKVPDQDLFDQRVTLFFENDALVRFTSDLAPTDAIQESAREVDEETERAIRQSRAEPENDVPG